MSLYGLIVGIAIIIGINYFEAHAPLKNKSKIYYLIFGTLISAFIGARAYHVADQWSYYSHFPSEIIKTWHGGLGIFGGLISGFLFILIFCLINKIRILDMTNAITPILPLCQAIGRLGNFINHENPVWWLEAIPDLLLYWVIRRQNFKYPTATYCLGYGTIRFLTEFFRHDTWEVNSFKIAQGLSILLIAFGTILLFYEKQKIITRHH